MLIGLFFCILPATDLAILLGYPGSGSAGSLKVRTNLTVAKSFSNSGVSSVPRCFSGSCSAFRAYLDKVSIRDIAAEANISVVTIYNHFRNKDGLILEIVKQTVHDQLESFRSVMEINVPFSEKIRMLMFNKAQAIADFHPDFAKWNESRNRQNVLKLFFPATWLHFVLAASSKTACLNLPHAATNSSLLPNRYIY
jgi:predicted DNA-binding protein YlxM (UPF0122 family)